MYGDRFGSLKWWCLEGRQHVRANGQPVAKLCRSQESMRWDTPRRCAAAKSAATKPDCVRYRRTRSAWRHASWGPSLPRKPQVVWLGWPMAAGCRTACIRLHDWRPWGLHGRPAAGLIYAPAVHAQGPSCRDRLADQAHTSSKASSWADWVSSFASHLELRSAPLVCRTSCVIF